MGPLYCVPEEGGERLSPHPKPQRIAPKNTTGRRLNAGNVRDGA